MFKVFLIFLVFELTSGHVTWLLSPNKQTQTCSLVVEKAETESIVSNITIEVHATERRALQCTCGMCRICRLSGNVFAYTDRERTDQCIILQHLATAEYAVDVVCTNNSDFKSTFCFNNQAYRFFEHKSLAQDEQRDSSSEGEHCNSSLEGEHSGPSSEGEHSGPSSEGKHSGPSSEGEHSGPSSEGEHSGPSSEGKHSGPSSESEPIFETEFKNPLTDSDWSDSLSDVEQSTGSQSHNDDQTNEKENSNRFWKKEHSINEGASLISCLRPEKNKKKKKKKKRRRTRKCILSERRGNGTAEDLNKVPRCQKRMVQSRVQSLANQQALKSGQIKREEKREGNVSQAYLCSSSSSSTEPESESDDPSSAEVKRKSLSEKGQASDCFSDQTQSEQFTSLNEGHCFSEHTQSESEQASLFEFAEAFTPRQATDFDWCSSVMVVEQPQSVLFEGKLTLFIPPQENQQGSVQLLFCSVCKFSGSTTDVALPVVELVHPSPVQSCPSVYIRHGPSTGLVLGQVIQACTFPSQLVRIVAAIICFMLRENTGLTSLNGVCVEGEESIKLRRLVAIFERFLRRCNQRGHHTNTLENFIRWYRGVGRVDMNVTTLLKEALAQLEAGRDS